jgi:hypothetical protein
VSGRGDASLTSDDLTDRPPFGRTQAGGAAPPSMKESGISLDDVKKDFPKRQFPTDGQEDACDDPAERAGRRIRTRRTEANFVLITYHHRVC